MKMRCIPGFLTILTKLKTTCCESSHDLKAFRPKNINSIGKQWIRRFALALTKEILGQIRGKFSTVPIPGESVTLNASELLGQAKAEQDLLRDELKTILAELTYTEIATKDASLQDSTKKVMENIPAGIYVG